MGEMYHIYLLKCCDGTLYCGITNNLDARVATHNCGKGAKYTRARLPVELVYSEEAVSRSCALKRERIVKKLSRAEKLQLIEVKNGKVDR